MRNVVESIVHQKYNPFTDDNDIALLKLHKSLQYSNVIKPVKLPSLEEDFTDQHSTVSGWGKTESSHSSEDLLFIEQRIMDSKVCQEMVAKLMKPKMQIKKGVICATSHDGKQRSACPGDSGGPIVLKDTSILVGIVSFGDPEDVPCGSLVDYNTRVSHYIDWIETNTNNIAK